MWSTSSRSWPTGRPGRSKSEIAQSLGVDRKTVGKWIAPAEAAGIRPDGPPLAGAGCDARVPDWSMVHKRLRDERSPAVTVASVRRQAAANLPEERRRS